MNNNKSNIEVGIYEVFERISTIIGCGLFFGVCVWIFIKAADFITRIIIIPFLICCLALLIKGIIALLQVLNLRKGMNDENISAESVSDKDEKLNLADKFFSKIYNVWAESYKSVLAHIPCKQIFLSIIPLLSGYV